MMCLRKFVADRSGIMAIETALVLPVLLLLGIGGFQVSEIVARQHNLQAAAAEAQQIALAAKPDSQTKLDTIKAILVASTGLPAANVNINFTYSCGTTEAAASSPTTCGAEPAWTYVEIVLNDTYSPPWTAFGVGSNVALQVDRKVQIS
jgi:Flp pilus assembly protein TadG